MTLSRALVNGFKMRLRIACVIGRKFREDPVMSQLADISFQKISCLAADRQKMPCEIGIFILTGTFGKFDKGKLDFLVTRAGIFKRTARGELLTDQIGKPGGNVEQTCFSGGPEIGNSSFYEMTG